MKDCVLSFALAAVGATAASASATSRMAGVRVPRLIIFDLDACLWSPEMFELDGKPTSYDPTLGGVKAGHDVVKLYPGALAVLRTIISDTERFGATQVSVASSTTRPAFANTCLDELVVDPRTGAKLATLVAFRQIYPGSKGSEHVPKLARQSNLSYDECLFFDDCTYGDNCADVASKCAGALCVRTPQGLTEELFERGLSAFARGIVGVM
jgi:magnesium-dependent phosphatase 1